MSDSATVADHNPALQHHFADMEQQQQAATMGMWVFLITEIMFFGGMFLAYMVYRYMYYAAFVAGSQAMDFWYGTINTIVLICSSLTMALAVRASQVGQRKALVALLIVTMLFGCAFMGIKAIEYTSHFHEHQLPGRFYRFEAVQLPGASMYWSLYFLMTGLHGLHVLVGMTVLSVILYRTIHGYYSSHYYLGIELAGLYWHLVDLIWIFLFPLLYLI